MRLWEIARLALESLVRSRLRTALTSFGIAIATGSLVAMVAFAIGLQNQMEIPFQKLGLLSNIEVRPKSDEQDGTLLDDASVEQFEALPGVDYAYPDFRLSEIRVTHKGKTESSYAMGLPREAALTGVFDEMLVAGEFFDLSDAREIILGERIVKKLGFASPAEVIGRDVEVAAAGLVAKGDSQFELQEQTMSVRVVGIFRPPGLAGSLGRRGVVLLPVDLMRHLPGAKIERSLRRMPFRGDVAERGYSQVIVHTDRPSHVFAVEKQIKEMGYETRSLLSRLEDARTFFLFIDVLLAAVGTVGLVVGGLGITNTLLMTVVERKQEIGLYKAIGASNGDVRVLFLTEAAIVGLAGGLAGLLLAFLASVILEWGIARYAVSRGVTAPEALFSFPLWLLASSVAFALFISIVSGLYPASRAARIDPIQALRQE